MSRLAPPAAGVASGSARPEMILFRSDASLQSGHGHVARCLTLANALGKQGFLCAFACVRQPGDAGELIKAQGHFLLELDFDAACGLVAAGSAWPAAVQERDASKTVAAMECLPAPPRWIIVDHYGLDVTWEERLAAHCRDLLVIDDLANRRHASSMLLDQNYYAGYEDRYDGLVPATCRLVLGPHHVLLRDEFAVAHASRRARDGSVHRILVSFGVTDALGETVKTLAALGEFASERLEVDVVVGGANPRLSEIESLCADRAGWRCHRQIDYMAELVQRADLAVGAGGSSMWERCALGLPCLTIVTADNQLRTTTDTALTGAIIYLGRSEEVGVSGIAAALRATLAAPERVIETSRHALALVPHTDGAARLARAMSSERRTVVVHSA